MTIISTVFIKCTKFRQCLSVLVLISALPCKAQLLSRAPASYTPDEDVIVRPIDNEITLYDRFVKADKNDQIREFRNQINIWNNNQQFADTYGMDSTLQGSAYFVPTPDEKWEYFKSNYMRYLRRRGEQPLKDQPKQWYREWRASDEIDSIDRLDSAFSATEKKTLSGKDLPDALKAKEVSVWKQTKFIFQPRVDQGLVVVGFRGPIAYVRAWVSVNGETEINAQKEFTSTGTRLMANYYTESGQYLSVVDQRITQHLTLRFTATKNKALEEDVNIARANDETVMLLYNKEF
jgi:hypothetical protein